MVPVVLRTGGQTCSFPLYTYTHRFWQLLPLYLILISVSLGTVAQTQCYRVTSYFFILLLDCNSALEIGLLTAAATPRQLMKGMAHYTCRGLREIWWSNSVCGSGMVETRAWLGPTSRNWQVCLWNWESTSPVQTTASIEFFWDHQQVREVLRTMCFFRHTFGFKKKKKLPFSNWGV